MNSTQHLPSNEQAAEVWRPPPARLDLRQGQAHVFRLALDLPSERRAALAGVLSSEEQERAARFRFAGLQERFIAAHGQMRAILAGCLNADPAALVFENGPHGKPYLRNHPQVCFNLSHSEGVGLLAVCTAYPVGVDVETVRPGLDYESIAQRFFAPAEVAALRALPAEQQVTAFYAAWTRKEAYLKARGLGLQIPLAAFVVSLAPGEPARLLLREPGAPNGPFSLISLDPGPGCAAALAVDGPAPTLHLWDWAA